jgi:hypothetical protein
MRLLGMPVILEAVLGAVILLLSVINHGMTSSDLVV